MTHLNTMLSRLTLVGALGVLVAVAIPAPGQEKKASPADGHTVHVTAPHVVAGKVMGPYHHYCKVLSPEPVIECLCYGTNEPNARLEQIEYIVAKSITRAGAMVAERGIPEAIPLATQTISGSRPQ